MRSSEIARAVTSPMPLINAGRVAFKVVSSPSV